MKKALFCVSAVLIFLCFAIGGCGGKVEVYHTVYFEDNADYFNFDKEKIKWFGPETLKIQHGEILANHTNYKGDIYYLHPIYPGYAFLGWFTEPGCVNVWKFYETPVLSDIVLFAGWEKYA